jgi:hypothetical protein
MGRGSGVFLNLMKARCPPESGGQRDPKVSRERRFPRNPVKKRLWNPLSRDFDYVSIALSP